MQSQSPLALPEEYIDEFKRIIDAVGKNMPGYVQRMSQKRMISAVAKVLSRAEDRTKDADGEDVSPPPNTGKSVLAVQGPTGVGKSLGYLIGATVTARAKKRKVVISSATVALQEQLITKDVPAFVKSYGQPLNIALAKGRTRYVCHHKLHGVAEAKSLNAEMDFGELWDRRPEKFEVELLSGLLSEYESKRWSGDRDELDARVPDELWMKITTDQHGCLKKGCACYNTCAQVAARNKLRNADIIISNHDLLLADMVLGGGVILSDPEETLYVLDEAHHLANKAVEAFANQHQVRSGGQELMKRLGELATKVARVHPGLSGITASISADGKLLERSMSELYQMLNSFDKDLFQSNGNLYRFENNTLPAAGTELYSNILNGTTGLVKSITELMKELEEIKKNTDSSALLDRFLTDLGFFKGRVITINGTWRSLTMPNSDDLSVPPIAKWVVLEQKKNGHDFSVCASPVSAADTLAEMFFKRANGVILTSATLMTLGNFDQLLRETGLTHLPDTSVLSLPSPFDFATQGTLSIPDIGASPKDAEAHTAAVIAAMPGLVEQTGNRGTLALFASRRQMTQVAEGLPPELRTKVMLQGERAKESLLSDHKRLIDDGHPSVLFGLQSFVRSVWAAILCRGAGFARRLLRSRYHRQNSVCSPIRSGAANTGGMAEEAQPELFQRGGGTAGLLAHDPVGRAVNQDGDGYRHGDCAG